MKTVILSDAHVGSCETDHAGLHSFLVNLDCDQLILAGDFLDLWECSVEEVQKKHRLIVEAVNHLAAKIKVVYVVGNHDAAYPECPLFNCPMRSSFLLESAGRQIVVVHGHEFDSWAWTYLTKPLCLFNRWVRKTIGLSYRDVHNDGRMAVANLRAAARKKYGSEGFGAVIAGHVHAPEHCPADVAGIEYVNCGDWKMHDTFVTVEDGRIELQRFSTGCKHI